MAKKSRRSKAKYRAEATKAAQGRHLEHPKPVTPEEQSFSGDRTKPVIAKSQVPSTRSRKQQYHIADYRYVERDVRHIGILAGSLIVILVILSFVLG